MNLIFKPFGIKFAIRIIVNNQRYIFGVVHFKTYRFRSRRCKEREKSLSLAIALVETNKKAAVKTD
jgi:hypothetical protein